MFERIKAYKRLKKADNVMRGIRRIGIITKDEEMIREANEVLYKNAILKRKIWFNRKMALRYNLDTYTMDELN